MSVLPSALTATTVPWISGHDRGKSRIPCLVWRTSRIPCLARQLNIVGGLAIIGQIHLGVVALSDFGLARGNGVKDQQGSFIEGNRFLFLSPPDSGVVRASVIDLIDLTTSPVIFGARRPLSSPVNLTAAASSFDPFSRLTPAW